MSRTTHLRRTTHWLLLWRVGLVCGVAIALLSVRSSGLNLLHSSPLRSTARSWQATAQSQFIDHDDGLGPSTPQQALHAPPPEAVSKLLCLADLPLVPLQSKGFHYNRPPPLS